MAYQWGNRGLDPLPLFKKRSSSRFSQKGNKICGGGEGQADLSSSGLLDFAKVC